MTLELIGLQAEHVIKIVLATALGIVIGIEREKSHKPAGTRTHALVCLGAALITVLSIDYFGMDPARIAAGVITGIGFLGAGAIIATRNSVHGLTTAASLWGIAAVGLAVGAGAYALSILAAGIMLIILILGKIE